MASWILVPCLVTLRDEFNIIAPKRDKASDGSIGDTAHASSSSDHNPDETGATPHEDADRRNEVHAIDVDDDLRQPGRTMQGCLNVIIARHRDGLDDRLQNIIYNRRIWSRTWGWTARAYTGSNAHTEHAHFSARYTAAQENDTKSWGLVLPAKQEEEEVADFDKSMITLTKGSAAELGGKYKEGTEISGETFANLVMIYAARANDRAEEARNLAVKNAEELAAIRTLLEGHASGGTGGSLVAPALT